MARGVPVAQEIPLDVNVLAGELRASLAKAVVRTCAVMESTLHPSSRRIVDTVAGLFPARGTLSITVRRLPYRGQSHVKCLIDMKHD
jgi:hypothetical protein